MPTKKIAPSESLSKSQRYELHKDFFDLARKLGKFGQYDAAHALTLLRFAICYDHQDTITQMVEAAERPTSTTARGGRPRSIASLAFEAFVRRVEEERALGDPDEAIVFELVMRWASILGPPPGATRDRIEYELQFRSNWEPTMSKLRSLFGKDAPALVRGVHRALGYPGTDNLANATHQKKRRAILARRVPAKTRSSQRS